jgi:hypothetical protein
MNTVHEDYIKNGEVKYTNKVDSLKSFSGKERILISGYISGAFNVNEIVATWNDGGEVQSFPYSKSDMGTDELNLYITGLSEKSYEFEIYSKDDEGNKSIPVTVFGTAYGETYRSTLDARAINTFSYSNYVATLNFKPSSDVSRNTEIKYISQAGETIVKSVLPEEEVAILDQPNIDQPIMYRTFYVPTPKNELGNETSIDEFDSDWETLVVPAIGGILESLSFNSVLGGVKANWSNPDGTDIVLSFEYTAASNAKTQTVESSDSDGEYTISGMDSGEQNIAVTIADVYGNSFGPKIFVVSPQAASQLDKTAWTIIDFSSEEAGGEGPINGYVTAAIDGDINTFWHTTWSTGSPDYPHHFTVDMGAEKTIASFEVFRRQNNGNGQTKHQFLVSNDGVTWTDLGTFDMNSGSNEGQIFPMSDNPTARYFKYVATEGPNNYAFMGEINVYGLE